jgi:hypothetical protein
MRVCRRVMCRYGRKRGRGDRWYHYPPLSDITEIAEGRLEYQPLEISLNEHVLNGDHGDFKE